MPKSFPVIFRISAILLSGGDVGFEAQRGALERLSAIYPTPSLFDHFVRNVDELLQYRRAESPIRLRNYHVSAACNSDARSSQLGHFASLIAWRPRASVCGPARGPRPKNTLSRVTSLGNRRWRLHWSYVVMVRCMHSAAVAPSWHCVLDDRCSFRSSPVAAEHRLRDVRGLIH